MNPYHTEQSTIIPSPEDYLPDSLPVSPIVNLVPYTVLMPHFYSPLLLPLTQKCTTNQKATRIPVR